MTREEMIVTIKTERAVAPLHTNAEKLIEAYDMAIEMIQSFPRWRPLSEGEPEEHERVVLIDTTGYVFSGGKHKDIYMDEDGGQFKPDEIKGWMPEGSLDKEIFWK